MSGRSHQLRFRAHTGHSTQGPLDDDSDRHRGDGDVEGKSWAMDERLQSEMEEAERDADRSWYVLVFLMLGRMSVMLIIPDTF
jgi:hypothetical protein